MRSVTFQLSCRTICSLLVVLVFLVAVRCSFGQSAKDAAARAQATALFAKALAVSDIRAPGSPPFEMRATITVKQRFGKPTIGSYLLEWASPEKWREEIHFTNYTRIRVGGKNQYWQSRTTSYEVPPLLQLSQGLEFLKTLHVLSNPAAMADVGAIKFHQHKTQGIKLDCVTLEAKDQKYGPDYCFDPATGALGTTGAIEFSKFISFGGKYFPGNIHAEGPSADPVTLEVNSITPGGSFSDADFQPPAGSASWPSCDAPDAMPTIKSQARPLYPMNEKLSHMHGTVTLYVLIGSDGRLSNIKLFSAPDRGLADSALTAVRQWTYKPETCGGTPVPVEASLSVIYDLGS